MTSKIPLLALFILFVVFMSSCSHRLIGSWRVERYETQTIGQQSSVLTNIGTMTFKKNGTGDQNLSYSILGASRNDVIPFTWDWNDGRYVTIHSDGTIFGKTWIIMENKRKFQRWKSTDGSNNIQTIELRK